MPDDNDTISYYPNRLRKMVAAGKTAAEITAELCVSPHELMDQLIKLQELDQKIYIILGLFDLSAEEKRPYRKEGIIFHKEILEKIDFKPGDAFVMKASGNQIIIEKIVN